MAQPVATMKPTAKSSTSCEKRLPVEERVARRPVAGREERVGRDDAREAVGVLADQAQADQTAPVLTHEREVAQVERVEQRGAHPLDVARVGVVGAFGRLVGAAEADRGRARCTAGRPR